MKGERRKGRKKKKTHRRFYIPGPGKQALPVHQTLHVLRPHRLARAAQHAAGPGRPVRGGREDSRRRRQGQGRGRDRARRRRPRADAFRSHCSPRFALLWFSLVFLLLFFSLFPYSCCKKDVIRGFGVGCPEEGDELFFFFLWSFFRNEKRRRIAKFEQKKRKEKKKRVKEEVDRGNYLLPTYLLPCWAALLLLAVVGVVPQVVLSYRCDLKS